MKVGDGLNTFLEPGSEQVFIYGFLAVILVAWLYTAYLLLIKSKPRKIEPFVLLTGGFGLHIPAFYHLFRCVSNNFGHGWMSGMEHEMRSATFGIAGLFWAAGVLCLLCALGALATGGNKGETKSTNRRPEAGAGV